MFHWLRKLWPKSGPRQEVEVRGNVTWLPVYATGPFLSPFIKREGLPQFMVPPAVRPVRGPKGTGSIFCWDHQRPLGWHEYQYWLAHTLPLGWAIMAEPNEGAELPGTRWRGEDGYWREEWGEVDDDAAAPGQKHLLTLSDIRRYKDSLPTHLQNVYSDIDVALDLEEHDPLSNEFQLAARLMDVFNDFARQYAAANPFPTETAQK